jgi:hypothetical protein
MQNSNPRDAQNDTPTSCPPPDFSRQPPTETDMRNDKRGAYCSSDAPADWPIQRGLCEIKRAEATGPSYSVGSSLGRAYMYMSGMYFGAVNFSGPKTGIPGCVYVEINLQNLMPLPTGVRGIGDANEMNVFVCLNFCVCPRVDDPEIRMLSGCMYATHKTGFSCARTKLYSPNTN